MAIGLVIALVATAAGGLLPIARSAEQPLTLPAGDARPASTSANTVSFGVLGDFDSSAPTYPDGLAEQKRLATRGADFLLAVGDLGYNADEQTWCEVMKGGFNNTEVVAGNHDTTQSGPGDINTDVIYCPFNLAVTLHAGPEYGYGISYYFDYPGTSPLVRVIMMSAGISSDQTANTNYNPGGADYNWVVSAITTGRGAGIPWVVVGVHKLCINAGSYGCEIGQSLWDAIVTAGADLLVTGHYHVYERTYMLNHNSTACTTISDGSFNSACVASHNTSVMKKGEGIVQVTDGAGGNGMYAIDTSGDGQYFPVTMGSNGNTQGKSAGWGPALFKVNATTLEESTMFCPEGSTDSTGECPADAPSTFQDSFTITSGSAPPPPPPQPTAVYTFSPTAPEVGQAVTFTGTASGGTAPYTYSWTFGDGATGSGAAVSHTYSLADTYTVVLTVTDAASQTAGVTHTVTVVEPQVPPGEPPVTSLTLAGRTGVGSWYTSAVTVTLTATSSTSPSVTIAYQLDGAEWRTYSAPFLVGEGLHTLRFNATDDAGREEATQTAPLKVDSLPPVLTVPASGLVHTTASFEFSWDASDAVSGVAERAVSLDGVPSAAFANETRMILTLSDGDHNVGLRATDGAGNRAWANVTLRVDTNVFSPTGPLQGMPSYVLIAIVAGVVLFLILHRRARAKRARNGPDLSHKRTYDR